MSEEREKRQDSDILMAHAEAIAAQTLLVGLMIQLRNTGFPEERIKRVFDYGADVATTSSYQLGDRDGGYSVRVLEVVERLRKAIIPD
jgi:hypothetical protein